MTLTPTELIKQLPNLEACFAHGHMETFKSTYKMSLTSIYKAVTLRLNTHFIYYWILTGSLWNHLRSRSHKDYTEVVLTRHHIKALLLAH